MSHLPCHTLKLELSKQNDKVYLVKTENICGTWMLSLAFPVLNSIFFLTHFPSFHLCLCITLTQVILPNEAALGKR